MEILSETGRRAIAAAQAEDDPSSLGAAERLRRDFPPELAAQALTQAVLRRRAVAKFPRAAEMFLTSDGVQQATRPQVARWRARMFAKAGVKKVWDLGCGLGADAMAFEEAGIRATAVEADEITAAFATANVQLVGGGPALHARAEDVSVPEGAAVFLDPARRTARGRSWNVADFSPPWSLVESYLASDHFCCVKLGPGLPKELIPDRVGACWVSVAGDVVEASLWNRMEPGAAAVVFPRGADEPLLVHPSTPPRELSVGPVGGWVIEPDNAVIRSGLVAEIHPEVQPRLVASGIAYLTSDVAPEPGPLADVFRVEEVLPLDQALLRRYVKQHRVGTLEIKVRGLDVDPAQLRRKLRPTGGGSATIILSRTPAGAVAIISERVVPGQAA